MRFLLTFALMCLLAGEARARDCAQEMPRGFPERFDAYRDLVDCLLGEIAASKRREAELRVAIEAQARAIAAIPAAYLNEDGRVSMPPDRPVGWARFVLSSRQTGGASSLALDRGVIGALCGGAGGCRISLIYRALEFGIANPVEVTGVGPCLFHLDPGGGGWFLGEGCGGPAARRGRDNDGQVSVNATEQASGGDLIAAAGQACLLADSDVNLRGDAGAGLLVRDQAAGLFLIAAPALQADPDLRFRCDLEIE